MRGGLMSALKILITGCRGRMGQSVAAAAEMDAEAVAERQIDAGDDLAANLAACDAVVDFSHHSFTRTLVDACVAQKKLLVIGTTGLSPETEAHIREAAKSIPIVFAPNFSVGVNTLFWLTRKAAEILGTEFDLEVVEMHHNKKIDSPSGTARRLGEILCEVAELSYQNDVRHGRLGNVGARTKREVGMHAVRGGDVVGDHTVMFAAQGERVELTHKASSRLTFASGAVRAAKWLRGKAPGLYDMEDVLELRGR
jgi:4-hydroxy-tetrahydrodipicolinate reductase